MPELRRKKKRRRQRNAELPFFQLLALICGYRDSEKYPRIPEDERGFRTLEQCKESWEANKTNPYVCHWLNEDPKIFRPGRRPWAWWKWESPEPRNYMADQLEQLRGMGALTEAEEDYFKKNPPPDEEFSLQPRPRLEEESKENQELIRKAEIKVKNADWFPFALSSSGHLSPADADAVVNYGCYLDIERAFHAIDFIEFFCRQSKGEWKGRPTNVLEWQRREFLIPLFGWTRPSGLRRFLEAYLEIAKKNGKSTIISAIEIYMAIGDGEGGPEVYSCAVVKDQAELVHKEAAKMIDRSPFLSRMFRNVPSAMEIRRNDESGDYTLKALAADGDTNEGKNAHCLVNDEFHVWKKAKFYFAMRWATSARKQPLIIGITTAGEELELLGGKKHLYAKSIISGEELNYSFLAVVYCIPEMFDLEDPAIHTNPDIIRLANPSLYATIDLERFIDDLRAALADAHEWVKFLRYRFNRWVAGGEKPYFPLEAWLKCGNPELKEEDFKGKSCTAGLDLSSREDLTAWVLCFFVDPKFYFFPRIFVPSAKVQEMMGDGDTRYHEWVESGHLLVIEGEVIDQKVILSQIQKDFGIFNIQEVAFDRWGADYIAQDLDDAGITVIPWDQNFSSMDYPTQEIKKAMTQRLIEHPSNPCFDYNVENVRVKRDPQDRVRPIKREGDKRYKIDAAVAAIMAFARSFLHEDFTSVYETEKPSDWRNAD